MAIAIDPVCGMEVETEGADLTATHGGTTYYFCGRGCLLDFRDEPDRFVGRAASSVAAATAASEGSAASGTAAPDPASSGRSDGGG